MAPPKPLVTSASAPKYGGHFDAWNSSSNGHQRSENGLSSSAGWRNYRSMKLSCQLRSGPTGRKRISDLSRAGSEDWDEKAKGFIPKDLKARARVSVLDMLLSKRSDVKLQKKVSAEQIKPALDPLQKTTAEPPITRGIFHGLTIYINGSTSPLISDHKLKCLLAEQGANISIHLGRRQVTHVILGNACRRAGDMGAGGGLAATKVQKEIKRTAGCGVRYVSVQWALESIKAGTRLSEARFSNFAIASKGQRSVYSSISKSNSNASGSAKESFDGF